MARTLHFVALLGTALFAAASCGADATGESPDAQLPLAIDAAPSDASGGDAGGEDAGPADAPDAGEVDASDAALVDAGSIPDASPPPDAQLDASTPVDAAQPDAGILSAAACQSGEGQALWRLSFPANAAGYATVEVWENGCSYSLADQACSLSGEPHDYANFGPGVLFNSSTDYFRVRYSAAGLSFSQATLYLSAHAEGSGIPNAILESPIYGSIAMAPTVPISTHRSYAVDWSDMVSPSDPPSLTAVTLRSNPSGLAISLLELCVQ